MNSLEIFQMVLNLPSPWLIKSVGFKEEKAAGKKPLHIDTGFILFFEAMSMALIENEMPVNKAAHLLDEYPQRI